MKILLNYANEYFLDSQKRNSTTGLEVGGFDRVVSVGPQEIDADFRARHRQTLAARYGNGYWLWKPYFVMRTLRDLAEGDFLFYCDSGAYFVAPIDPLVEICRRDGQDVLPFENNRPEKTCTKRDALVALDCDRPQIVESSQRHSSFMLWRKSAWSLQFAEQWLTLSEDARLLTDSRNEMGLPNYAGFIKHHHDQSLFSLLTKQRGLAGYRCPSQFGLACRSRFPNSPYDQLIEHTRKRQLPLRLKILRELTIGYEKLRALLPGGRPRFVARKRRAA